MPTEQATSVAFLAVCSYIVRASEVFLIMIRQVVRGVLREGPSSFCGKLCCPACGMRLIHIQPPHWCPKYDCIML